MQPPDYHWHRCDDCGTTWSHHKSKLLTAEQALKAHDCPTCGASCHNKFYFDGDEPADIDMLFYGE